ncbi:MAG: bifunctional phosphopantothenoylcysteine decarboxylase/phosphopantothenate--cysteine ligase CoaBC [Epulopiscium sp.]|nr:bifunctional phosphopantothenoylcysteine decarboxylase/phosphopantothenate--cysteine ligase CoaBC [Candidatus Epulonipiscium sp.]
MSKNIVIGVTGGIAAYKMLDVTSTLRKKGYEVDVIMTKNACEFVQPLSFQTISGNKVIVDTFEPVPRWEVEHIELAKKADLFLVAPATANILGKIANGIADDMLTTTIMATKAPVILAPAMNTNMYDNPIVQENIEYLKQKGYEFIEPASGFLACGDIGKGRLASPEDITDKVISSLEKDRSLDGRRILITAGPTIEEIDPVRYLSNHSSGKMGYEIAEEAVKMGADVRLISGPTSLPCPKGVKRIGVKSARDMYQAVHQEFDWSDVVIKVAAVADYRPVEVSSNKLKKDKDNLTIELEKNPDILKSLGEKKANKILIGFAAESNNLIDYASKKLKDKNLDFIVANNITEEGAGFGGDTNLVTIIKSDGSIKSYEKMTKKEVARIVLGTVPQQF